MHARSRTSGVRLSGVGKGKPKLTFTAAAGTGGPALKSVSVSLPGGLSFAGKAKSLTRGTGVKSGSKRVKFKPRASHGTLTISFKKSVRNVTVTITRPALGVSGSLRRKALHHKVKKLTVGLRTTDTGNATTKFSVKVKLNP